MTEKDVAHVGEDLDGASMEDIREEDAQADERADALVSGDFSVEATDSDDVSRPDDVASCRFCNETFGTQSAEYLHECPGRDRLDSWEPRESAPVITPATHGLGAKLLFADPSDGLAPFFGLVSQFDRLNHAQNDRNEDGLVDSVELDGERWRVEPEKTRMWTGGIATRNGDSGSTYYEYQIGLEADDDLGERKATLQFRPALPDARTEDGSRIKSMPQDMSEGIRVQVGSSNVERAEVVPLIRALADAIGVRSSYFDSAKIHSWSRLYNFEKYARTDTEESEEKITNRGGLLDQLAKFGSNNRGRGEYKWNNEQIQGHRSAVAMTESQWSKLIPNRTVGTLLKSYHMKQPEKHGSDSVTSNPKLEVQYSTEYSDIESVPWRSTDEFDADDLERELDENLVNALSWAGFDTRANENQYVADPYFAVEESERDVRLYENPLGDVEELEGDIAQQQFHREDATDGERDVLEVLADGGRYSYEQIAERSGTSKSTVYRALDRFSSVVRRLGAGEYSLEDDIIADKFSRLFSLVENAAEFVDRSLEDAIRDLELLTEADSPFARWMQTYGINADDDREELRIDVNAGEFDKYEIMKILRRGLEAARGTGPRLASMLLDAEVRWKESGSGFRTDRPFKMETGVVKIFGSPVR